MADLVFDVVRSLTEMGFSKIILVNGHGHHPAILEMVAREVADETGVYIAAADVAKLAAEAVRAHRRSAPGGCIHGGEFETSLMLHLGEPVDMSLTTDEDVFTHDLPFFPRDGFAGSKLAFLVNVGHPAQQDRHLRGPDGGDAGVRGGGLRGNGGAADRLRPGLLADPGGGLELSGSAYSLASGTTTRNSTAGRTAAHRPGRSTGRRTALCPDRCCRRPHG